MKNQDLKEGTRGTLRTLDDAKAGNNWQGVILSGRLKVIYFNSSFHRNGRKVILTSGPKCPECGQRLSGAILPQVI